ncbi:hypothetical protein LWC34_53730 [Kibdelosporangium philippinense]|uniref:FtsX extracellular domain-containing protein n=1 Tax=Kibdelosporangium philippinense TaxID=211113 RepID=A0ABS8ZX15_9PSEU|nr:hypothetical protein [Kibdelosporangium philippinense]MCE7011620.1 hypothetical protein [Kibdelosporangium philippinense]
MKPRLLLSVVAAIALVIAGAAAIVLYANQPPRRTAESYYERPTRPANVPPPCEDVIEITFATDALMNKAAPELEADISFYNPHFVTQAQNYERLKLAFANQPDVLKAIRPESVPASVTLWVSNSGRGPSVMAQLRQSYGPTNVVDPCAVPGKSSTRPVPTTTR